MAILFAMAILNESALKKTLINWFGTALYPTIEQNDVPTGIDLVHAIIEGLIKICCWCSQLLGMSFDVGAKRTN